MIKAKAKAYSMTITMIIIICILFITSSFSYASVLVLYNDGNFNIEAKIGADNYFYKKVYHQISSHKQKTVEIKKENIGNMNTFSVTAHSAILFSNKCEPLFIFRDYAIVFKNVLNKELKCYAIEIDKATLAKLMSENAGK